MALSNTIEVISEFRFTRFWIRGYRDVAEGSWVYERYDYGKLIRQRTFRSKRELDAFFAEAVAMYAGAHAINARRKPYVRRRDVPRGLPKDTVTVYDPAKINTHRTLTDWYLKNKLPEQIAFDWEAR